MKNLSALILLVILFGSSCTKEDPNPLAEPIVWKKEFNESDKSRFINDPFLYKNFIIYPLRGTDDQVGKLVAYNKENGEMVWEWQKAFDDYGSNGFSFKSYIYENLLICGDNNLSYGIDLNTGITLWDAKGDIHNAPYYCGIDNKVYSYDYINDEINYLKETNVLDGTWTYLWEFARTDEYKAYMGLPFPIEWQGKSYVTVITGKWIGSDQNYFLNLYDLDNKKLAWTSDTIPLQVPLSGIPGLRPQFNEGKILLANDAIYSYNIEDGSLAWRADYGNTFVLNSHITAADGKVWGNNDTGFCVGLDVHTGREIFNTDTGGSTSRILYHDNKIYLGSVSSLTLGRNLIMVLNANNGRVIKQIEAPYFLDNYDWRFNKNMEIDPETGFLYTGDHRYAMCIDLWK